MTAEFKLPELGENITSGTIIRVMIAAGDTVKKDQGVVEVETDKAAIEVPSAVGGKVVEVKVKQGDKVSPGQVLFTVDAAEPAPAAAKPAAAPLKTAPSPSPVAASAPASENGLVPAAPAARRLARENGIDIARVHGTGPEGLVTMDDVKASLEQKLPDFSQWGPVERQAMSGVRRATAQHMNASWKAVPHVTQYDRADITELENLRKKIAPGAPKITVTAVALKIVSAALQKFPQFNASVDQVAGEIVLKKYCHIGVAVDTERGLLVPVLRDADKKSIRELSAELSAAAEKARNKKLSLDDMKGGTFTITNLGGIGGTNFSPIVNWPEVAILGMSRASVEPIHVKGSFIPRTILPLSLSYDHRLIDGADGARFLRWVAQAFEEPSQLAFE